MWPITIEVPIISSRLFRLRLRRGAMCAPLQALRLIHYALGRARGRRYTREIHSLRHFFDDAFPPSRTVRDGMRRIDRN